jgi:hypothetical protein
VSERYHCYIYAMRFAILSWGTPVFAEKSKRAYECRLKLSTAEIARATEQLRTERDGRKKKR